MVRGLNTVLAEMEGIYNSIDVRVAAFRKGSGYNWQNYITVIRYSYLPKDELEKQQKALRGLNFPDQPEKFMIGYKALPIDGEVLDRQNDGTSILKLSDITTAYYWKNQNPNELYFNYSEWPEFQCDHWGALYGQTEESSSGISIDGSFMGEVSELSAIFHNEKADAMKMTFNSISKAMKHYLQTRNEVGWHHPMVYYFLPFYAKMSKPYYKDGQLCVDVERHCKLSELAVNYIRGRPMQYSTGVSWGIDEVIVKNNFEMQSEDKSRPIIKETIKLEYYKADVLEKVPDELIAVSLVYPRLDGIVISNYEHNRIRELLAVALPKVANPLFASFGLFCSDGDFEKMLFETHLLNEKESKLKQSQIFERAIAWLLELGGYRTVWLGDKEKWREVSGFEYGSADILALNAETRRLYVVGCSLKPPKRDEVSAIARMSKDIDSKLFGQIYSDREHPVDIVPVYFYASKKDKGITELAKAEGVLAISLEAFESLYEGLRQKGAIGDLKALENYIYMQGEAI